MAASDPPAPVQTEPSTAPAAAEGGAASSSSRSTSILDDAKFKQAQTMLKEEKYEEALEFLGPCMFALTQQEKQTIDADDAQVYFAYGDALLLKCENSADLFGEAVKEHERKAAAKRGEGEGGVADGAEEGGEEEDGQDDEEEEAEEGNEDAEDAAAAAEDADLEKKAIPEEVQEDLEVAWENLEAARVGFNNGTTEEARRKLGEVHMRLGDLQKLNGNYMQAVDDYLKSIAVYSQVLPQDHRDIANVHYNVATSYVYASAVEGADEQDLKQKALDHYLKCSKIFSTRLEKLEAKKTAGQGGEKDDAEMEDFKSIITELSETIEATRLEMDEARKPAAASGALPVTTIGFGAPSSTNGAAAPPAQANTVMAVKRKPKPASADGSSSTAAAASLPAAAGAAQGNGDATKKRVAPEGQDGGPPAKGARVD